MRFVKGPRFKVIVTVLSVVLTHDMFTLSLWPTVSPYAGVRILNSARLRRGNRKLSTVGRMIANKDMKDSTLNRLG